MAAERPGNGAGHTVVVTVDMESNLPPTLELAVAMAVARQCRLHGLFIEDVDLLRVADLPFTREISLSGGELRSFDYQQLARALNARSLQFRELLAELAGQSALAWSYDRVRGRRRHMEMGEGADAEFLIIGQPATRRPRMLPRKRIVVVNDHSPRLRQALEVVLARFPRQPIDLVIANAGGELAPAQRQELRSLLEQHPHSTVSGVDHKSFLHALAALRETADYIIAARQLDPLLLRELMRNATCPVIVVS